MSDGKDCKCAAFCESLCCCGVDWTPQEVYDLRTELKKITEERDVEIKRSRNAEERVKKLEQELRIAGESFLCSENAWLRNGLNRCIHEKMMKKMK